MSGWLAIWMDGWMWVEQGGMITSGRTCGRKELETLTEGTSCRLAAYDRCPHHPSKK